MNKKLKVAICVLTSLAVLTPFLALAQWYPIDFKTESNLPAGSIYGIILNLMRWILGIFGFIGIIGFVIAGIMYLTAAGSDDQIEKAKKAMKWSIVGIVVGLAGLVVIYAVDRFLIGTDRFF